MAEQTSKQYTDLLDIYYKDISRISPETPLSQKQVEILYKRLESGDQEAKQILITSNLFLAVYIAKKYQNSGLPLADLVQEANIGLMKAVDKFDWRQGHAFSTYAAHWIRQAVLRALEKQSRTIRLPAHVITEKSKLKAKEEISAEEEKRLAEISITAIPMANPLVQEANLMNLLPDIQPTALDKICQEDMRQRILETIQKILRTRRIRNNNKGVTDPDREFKILMMVVVEGKTATEVGRKFGISSERVAQIIKEIKIYLQRAPSFQLLMKQLY